MIILRDLHESDRAAMRQWRNRDHVRQRMVSDHIITIDEHDRWFDSVRSSHQSKYWIIVEDDVNLGVCNLANIDRVARTCSSALYIADSRSLGRGIGTAAEYLMLDFAFDQLSMNAVWCEIYTDNAASLRMHQGLGFTITECPERPRKPRTLPSDLSYLVLPRHAWAESRRRVRAGLVARGHLR